jgi:phospholipid N-methyltransferase
MHEQFISILKLAGATAAGTLSMGFAYVATIMPESSADWIALIKEVGVIGFAIVAIILGLGWITPKILKGFFDFLDSERLDAKESRKEFLEELRQERRAREAALVGQQVTLKEFRDDFRGMLKDHKESLSKDVAGQTEAIKRIAEQYFKSKF